MKKSKTLDIALGGDGTLGIIFSPGADIAHITIDEAEQVVLKLSGLIVEAKSRLKTQAEDAPSLSRSGNRIRNLTR